MAAQFKSDSTESLMKQIADKREALRVFRFQGEGSRRRDVREGRNVRRDIARILTELRERTLPAGRHGIASEAKKA